MNSQLQAVKSELTKKLDFYRSRYDATAEFSSLSPFGQMMSAQVTNAEAILGTTVDDLKSSFWYLFSKKVGGASTSERCAAAVLENCKLPPGYTFQEALERLDPRQLAAVLRVMELEI